MKKNLPSSVVPFLFTFLLALQGSLNAQSQQVPQQAQLQQAQPQQQNSAASEDLVKIQLPNSPVSEVLNAYQMLTGKQLIRDAYINGPNQQNLSVQVGHPIPKQEAIALLEAALTLNGYTIVPVNEHTSKILGSTKSPTTEGTVLYAQESELPTDERVLSYFMPFRYISASEAVKIFTPYATARPFASIIAVPNANAVVITENTHFIKRLIALQKFIDIPGKKMLTEFVTLKRADAEKVAETLNELLEEETKKSAIAQSMPSSNLPATGTQPNLSIPAPKIHIKADVRTNRLVLIAPESRMSYLHKLIQEMDGAVDLDELYERHLQFLSAGDVLPILANILSEGGKEKDIPQITQNLTNPSSSGLINNGGTVSGTGSGIAGKADKLHAPTESTAPMSLIVGKSRLIADRNANKIMVIGPPEARLKAKQVLDKMDERPKQIFLATIIGQVTLGDESEVGMEYLAKVGNHFHAAGPTTAASSIANLASTAGQIAQSAMPGLNMYGTIANSLDVYVHALQSTNRFRLLSRPMIFTTNNKKAVISSGQQVPVPQSTLTNAIAGGNNGTAVAATIDYKDVVLKLEVVPLVNSNDEVTLTIAQQNDTLEDAKMKVGDNQVPVINTQELTTTVTVRNKEIVALGGLITKQEKDIHTGVPLLKDIPVAGHLFGTTKRNFTRRELVVFIQPFVINGPSDLAEANKMERSITDFKGDLIQDLKDQKPVKTKKKKTRVLKAKRSYNTQGSHI